MACMLTVRFEIAGRLLLAASVVLASNGAPGVCHAHEDGERPHEHRAKKQDLHEHPGHQHSHAGQDQRNERGVHPTKTADRCSSSTRHLHFSWFGLNFTLPAPSDEDESSHEFSGPQEMVIVRPLDVTILATPTGASFGTAWLALLAVEGHDFLTAVPALPQFSSIPVAADSLCDAARHERSGVQLS